MSVELSWYSRIYAEKLARVNDCTNIPYTLHYKANYINKFSQANEKKKKLEIVGTAKET